MHQTLVLSQLPLCLEVYLGIVLLVCLLKDWRRGRPVSQKPFFLFPPYLAFDLDIARWLAPRHRSITTADQRSSALVGEFDDDSYEANARRATALTRVSIRLRAQHHPVPNDPHPYLVACRGRFSGALQAAWPQTLFESSRMLSIRHKRLKRKLAPQTILSFCASL